MARIEKSATHAEIDGRVTVEQGLSGSWYCFRLEDDPTRNHYEFNKKSGAIELLKDHPLHNKRWMEKGKFATREEAEALAATL